MKIIQIIPLLIILMLFIPMNYSDAAPRNTKLALDSISKEFHVGENIIFTGKLVDSQNYMLTNEKISITPSPFLFKTIGTGMTDARGNFRIIVPAELWNGDGNQVTFVAHYDGSSQFVKSTSNYVTSIMRKAYTPLGQENNYEQLKDEGYYNQNSIPQTNTVPSSNNVQTKSSSNSYSLTCGSGTHESNGECVPDNQSKGGGCLIATATYGSELAPQV